MVKQLHPWNSPHCASAWLTLIVVLVLAGCGGQHPDDPAGGAVAAPISAEEVHTAFLVALRANNREQVIALTVDDQQAARAETWLRIVQSYMHSTATEGPYATGGNLSAVEVVKVDERGAARRGWSRWAYARKAICHIADLAQTPEGWRVTSFHTTTEACTPDS
ncbi:MAG: hypothetical protein M3380_02075 [Chloroflexota bacterium]|nr:hypothetical protein [Chloroflexota bacterium]